MISASAPRPSIPAPSAPPASLDPADGRVWDGELARGEHAPLAPRGFAALAPSLVLGAIMLAVMFAVSAAYDLPVRDADGILGSRAGLLVMTIAAFVAIDIVPRAGSRVGWDPGGCGRRSWR